MMSEHEDVLSDSNKSDHQKKQKRQRENKWPRLMLQ